MARDDLDLKVMDPANPQDGVAVVVLMHGRGADPSDLAGLRRWIPDAAALVLPRAPFQASEWGYGPGWAWYQYAGEDRPEIHSFRASQEALHHLLESLPEALAYAPGPIVLGGFSQGGTMATGYALRRPGRVAGVMNLSGFLPQHPDVPVTRDAVGETPFFWGHGISDPAIPHALAERGRGALLEAGADLDARDYPMGHAISPDELRDAVAWMERVIG